MRLTPTELLKVNLVDSTEQLTKARQETNLVKRELAEAKVLELQLKLAIAKKDLTSANEVCYNTGSVADAAKERKSLLKELADKYELEGVWGYDPQTGDIV